MNWFIVAIMAMVHTNGDKDLFVFTDPYFETSQECISYVQENQNAVMLRLAREFPNNNLDKIMCVPEENVEKIMESTRPIPEAQTEI
ncbi:MAG: hypothetical protein CL815_00095 [Coraliomargarita sp.]|nr:hypothetical protein [Coraliomargarita sp.]